jgi:outer membrane immunogenic protein
MLRKPILGLLGMVALATSADAADIYRAGGFKDTPYVMAPIWTGFYLGAHVGGAWGDVDVRDLNGGVLPGPFSFSPDGVFGGGTGGYNLQFGSFLFGIEGDIGYMDLSGAGIIPSANPGRHQDISLDGGLYGDITARLGYAFDRMLVYAKGGFAFYDSEGKQVTTTPGYVHSGTDTLTGWTAGGGIEYLISPSWSIKAEYLHFDFGSQGASQTSVGDDPIGFVYKNKFDVTAESVKAGVNYHIGQAYTPLK